LIRMSLADPAGTEVWVDTQVVEEGGASFGATLPDSILSPGTWHVRASAEQGAAGFVGTLRVTYPQGAA
jgi:hypothetical protein